MPAIIHQGQILAKQQAPIRVQKMTAQNIAFEILLGQTPQSSRLCRPLVYTSFRLWYDPHDC